MTLTAGQILDLAPTTSSRKAGRKPRHARLRLRPDLFPDLTAAAIRKQDLAVGAAGAGIAVVSAATGFANAG